MSAAVALSKMGLPAQPHSLRSYQTLCFYGSIASVECLFVCVGKCVCVYVCVTISRVCLKECGYHTIVLLFLCCPTLALPVCVALLGLHSSLYIFFYFSLDH